MQRPGFKGCVKRQPDAPVRTLKSDSAGGRRQFRVVPVSQARMHRRETMLDKQGHYEEVYERVKTRNESKRRRLPVSFLSQQKQLRQCTNIYPYSNTGSTIYMSK